MRSSRTANNRSIINLETEDEICIHTVDLDFILIGRIFC